MDLDRPIRPMTEAEKLDVVKTVSARIFINLTKEYAANSVDGNARKAISKAVAYVRVLDGLYDAVKKKEVVL